ncbi:MAG: hypothetical protein WB771_02515 [Solirubrobacterales bacterium]
MAEGRIRAPRVRMPKITLPGRSPRTAVKKTAASGATPKEQPKTGNGAQPTAAKDAAKPATTKPAETPSQGKAPDPNLQERIEGLQGWMAEIERKQGRMTYFGFAAVLIAILAAGAALYFGLTAKSDSATKSDLDALTKRIDSLEAAATKNSKDTQAALNASVSQLQQSIASVQKQQAQNAASISTLQTQAASGAFGKGAGAGAGAGTGAALTPGATTTTPKGK